MTSERLRTPNEIFGDAFEATDTWEQISVERPKITADYIRDLLREEPLLAACSLKTFVEYLENEQGL